jgi:hypothetical protein
MAPPTKMTYGESETFGNRVSCMTGQVAVTPINVPNEKVPFSKPEGKGGYALVTLPRIVTL